MPNIGIESLRLRRALGNKDRETRPTTFPPSPAAQLPEGIVGAAVSPATLPDLRALNASVFPVAYNDRFYADLALHPPELSLLAYDGLRAVGAVCARLEWDPSPSYPEATDERAAFPPHPARLGRHGDPVRVYLMTIGVDTSYRRSGLGSALLSHIVRVARNWGSDNPRIGRIVLHVHVKNEEAVAWYLARGFRKVGC